MSVVKTSKRTNRISGLSLSSLLIVLILALPIAVIIGFVFKGSVDVFSHLYDTVLIDYVTNSLLLMFGVGAGVLLLGIPTAWLTSVCDFPGRKIFAWALLLPLAVPAYIIAYTYTGLLDYAGPVQVAIREITGLGYGEYWFFEIRSLPGAVVMLALVLYPYVYLLSRAAFLEQSASTLEVSRTLGYNQWQGLFKLALPLARPAIIAGLTLALMETLADYGTVQYFGVSTFTTGIFRTFYGFGDSAAAAQLAAFLLGFVALLVLVEKYSRRKARYHSSAEYKAKAKLIPLAGWKAAMAYFICLIPVLFGFLIPAIQLAYWSFTQADLSDGAFAQLAWNSFYLAFLAALIAVGFALILAYAKRLNPRKIVSFSVATAGMGYALPGTIIAVGVIIPFAWLDHQLIALASNWFGVDLGLILSGTLVALLFAYTVRFLAVSLGAVQSGLDKIKPSLDGAARTLGSTPLQVLRQIHVPLMKSSVLTALLIVFVDVLKELPATLILRPFNFNTLAVRAFELASDERLVDAAPASLLIVVVGLLPVILLSRSIAKGRTGS
ncbi:iron ABC transporter permease [Neptuniibacter sp. UBA6509]|uniref:ABC transporter permease n=2 Tax=unclassified Neptuniibacter TaxID=2630693 RepID=UPI0025DE8728|nr:iron ABC transporter permease [Neptuniibacter sp. UBA6509]|tara:strand:+ start:1238 stop:2893 length:1656 start_codon:yes stop_codon:yes gene_type:complete